MIRRSRSSGVDQRSISISTTALPPVPMLLMFTANAVISSFSPDVWRAPSGANARPSAMTSDPVNSAFLMKILRKASRPSFSVAGGAPPPPARVGPTHEKTATPARLLLRRLVNSHSPGRLLHAAGE